MKKSLLLSTLLIACTMLLFGQEQVAERASRFNFGLSLEAGYSGNADNTKTEYPNDFGNYIHRTKQAHRPGFSVGLWGTYQLGRRWDVQLGLNYGQWHAYANLESENYNTEGIMNSYSRESYEVSQSLLRIPLQGRFFFGQPEARVRPFLSLGVQAAYLLKQNNFTRTLYGGLGQETQEYEYYAVVDLDPEWFDIRRWQWSLLSGIGIQMDRATLSIHRNWTFSGNNSGDGNIYRYYPDYCGFGGAYIDDYYPACNNGIRQLRQTSLRFSYRLF